MISIIDLGCKPEKDKNYSVILNATATNQLNSWIIKPVKYSAWFFPGSMIVRSQHHFQIYQLFCYFKGWSTHLNLSTVDAWGLETLFQETLWKTSLELSRISWRLQLGIGLCVATLHSLPECAPNVRKKSCIGWGWYNIPLFTPLKINMEHNHGGLEDHVPF